MLRSDVETMGKGPVMKLLVLGGGGFIGSHLVERLLLAPEYELTVFDKSFEKLPRQHSRLIKIQGEIQDEHRLLKQLVAETDLVIDLIAHANPSLYMNIPLEVVRLNFDENLYIAESCAQANKRLIQFSTCEVYGKTPRALEPHPVPFPGDGHEVRFVEDESHFILGPVNRHRWIYSCAKQLLERVLHAYGLAGQLNYTIVRPFNFIGPRIDYLPGEQDGSPRVFSHFLQSLRTGAPLQLVNGGQQQRCYTYIDDAVDCIFRIVQNPGGVCDRQIFNIGSPENELTIRELAIRMRQVYARRWWSRQSPLSELIDVSGEEFYGPGYDDCDRRVPDIAKARQLLGWQPQFNVDQTIEQSMEYWFERKQPVENQYRHAGL